MYVCVYVCMYVSMYVRMFTTHIGGSSYLLRKSAPEMTFGEEGRAYTGRGTMLCILRLILCQLKSECHATICLAV